MTAVMHVKDFGQVCFSYYNTNTGVLTIAHLFPADGQKSSSKILTTPRLITCLLSSIWVSVLNHSHRSPRPETAKLNDL